MATRKYRGKQLREFRSAIAKLKSKGLVNKSIDARRVKPTSHMVAQVRKFQDVVAGSATVLTAKTPKQAKTFSGTFPTKGKKIAVPHSAAEKPRFNKRTGEIREVKEMYGRRVSRRVMTQRQDTLDDLRSIKPKRGHVLRFAVPFGKAPKQYWQRFSDISDLVNFMNGYEVKPHNPYKDWRKYVVLEDVPIDEYDEEEGEDDHDAPDEYAR